MAPNDDSLYSLDELDYYILNDGSYVFIANDAKVKRSIDALGFSFYYLVGTKKQDVKRKNQYGNEVTTTVSSPAIFRVASTPFMSSIAEVTDDGPELESFEAKALYHLPKIPWDMKCRIEQFFREVDAKYHTESIVLLTIDTTMADENGHHTNPDAWGVLVPSQTNSSTACDYDPTSIAAIKPAHVQIVGSIHSHPHMSAYASGVDHGDQLEFEGIHVTFGWQHSGGNVLEVYAELQMGDSTYKIDPGHIFEPPPAGADVEVPEAWVDQVQVATVQTFQGTGFAGGSSSRYSPNPRLKMTELPKEIDISTDVIVVRLPYDDHSATGITNKCGACGSTVIKPEFDKRQCSMCKAYFLTKSEKLDDMIALRLRAGLTSPDLNIEFGRPHPITIYDPSATADSIEQIPAGV